MDKPPPDLRVTSPMMMRAATVQPSSFQEDDNSIEVVFSTGAAVTRYDWWDDEYYDETLSLDEGAVRLERLNAGATFLADHRASLNSVIGSVSPGTARIEGGLALARIRLATTEDVAALVAKIRDGHVRTVSVGYVVHEYTMRDAGEGKRKEMRATDWEPYEISAVAIPADAGAVMRARSAEQGGFPCIVRGAAAQAKETRMDPTTTSAPAPAPTATPAPTPAPTERQAEHVSVATIMERGKVLGNDAVVTLIGRHTTDPMTALDLERAINDVYASRNPVPEIDNSRVEVTHDQRDKWIEGATHWLIVKAGLRGQAERAARQRGENLKIDPGEFRGVSMLELARESVHALGLKPRSRDPKELVGLALTGRSAITQGTSDFVVLLENVMHKTVQDAYRTTADTWSRWCGVGSVSDFRDHNRYLRGSFGALDLVNELGEFKNKPIPDGAREKIRALTKGNIISLSRQAIINDDMGVFSGLATDLGRAAKLSIEIDAYALLASNPAMADGNPLFDASHGNLETSGVVPSVAAIDAMRVAMAKQKDVSGNEYLDIAPSIWLGPIGLGSAVRVINDSQYDHDSTKLQKPNPVAKIFTDVVDTARLSGTAWYTLSDPNMAPAIEVVFLNGEQDPFVDSQEGWRIDGVEWKVRHDYGVGAVNWRAIRKNPGA